MIIREYLTPRGKNLFRSWLAGLSDDARERIQSRIMRIRSGNLGDFKPVGHGVLELRLHTSPGFRIYFAWLDPEIILLVGGGDKHSQRRDIIVARQCWIEYRMR